jgi:beta-lactamase class A
MRSRTAALAVALILLTPALALGRTWTATSVSRPLAAPAALPLQQDESAPLLYSSAPDYPDAGLQDILDSYLDDAPGSWAASVKKLDTGQYAAVNGHAQAVSASLYKLWVLYEVLRQNEDGDLSLDDTEPITAANAAYDQSLGELNWTIGDQPRVSLLLDRMITVSDNTAALTLANLVGPDNVNASLRRLGLNESELNFNGGDNLTTASDYTHLLEMIATGRALDRDASRYMVNLMLAQQLNDLLPVGLPNDTPIAHKTGTLDLLMHDAGIVYSPSGPYVITVLSWNLPTYATAYDLMPRLSQAVYQYFTSRDFKPARYFPETKQVVGPAFLLYYNSNGGQNAFGLPIGPETTQDGKIVQLFERARMERAPGGGPVGLGNVGLDLTQAQGRQFEPTAPADPKDPNTLWFAQTRQAIGQPFLSYWRAHGGQPIFGLPISNIVVEQRGSEKLRVQYFEKARFELHGDSVQLGRIGSELAALQH